MVSWHIFSTASVWLFPGALLDTEDLPSDMDVPYQLSSLLLQRIYGTVVHSDLCIVWLPITEFDGP